jgi:5-formyltetrahydrofolate cyclo-ligase
VQDKDSLRKELLRKREAIPPEVRKIKDRLIREGMSSLEELQKAGTLFFFASFRSEVDTMEMIRNSLAEGMKVVLPKVERSRKALDLYEVRDVGELTPGYMGIPEPSVITEDRQAAVDKVDVVIIPGAAFDLTGNRIGYGGGYYDRLLSDLKSNIPIIAPAYEEQIADSIPAEPHDKKVNIIVTDRRVIHCRG